MPANGLNDTGTRCPRRSFVTLQPPGIGVGTGYLIISAIPLEQMGFPKLSGAAPSSYAEPILRTVPRWVAGLALFLGALHQLQRRQSAIADQTESAEPSGGEDTVLMGCESPAEAGRSTEGPS